ncbi:MAG TPA: (2Fe-2S)-binding protein [Isosphaeraceae bacterium]|nr:(2Fe-2S)-binding protein [Isosphaeraceae bacterium]
MELLVNGVRRQVTDGPDRSLLSVLRDELDLTGSKYGCGEGRCGACSVLVDGEVVRSCLTRVDAVGGKAITTIEGIAPDEEHLHPLQQAFLDLGAFQCGYCTSGMIVAGAALLARNPKPTDREIVDAMDGNICRCGTYSRILAAIRQASGAEKEGRHEPR